MLALRFRTTRVASLAFAALALAACSGGDDGPNGPAPSIQITTGNAAIAIQQGVVAQLDVGVTRSAFDGPVTLALTGLPAGITATINPSPVTPGVNNAIVAISVAGTTTPGTYDLTLRATGDGVETRTLPVTLTVTPAPAYAIALSQNALTVVQGGQGTVTVGVQRANFAGNITLAVTGLPAGVTATFSQNPVGDATGLTLTASATVAPGQYALVVRGTAEGLTERAANLALTVAEPQGFAIATGQGPIVIPAPIPQGAQANVNLGITRTGGFAGAVTLTATSPHPGITAAFAPATTNGASSTMTIAVAAGTPTGIHTLTIRGNAAGQVERTAPFQVQVTANGGQGNTLYDFCSPAGLPLWFAYSDGGGAFVRVDPQGNQFRFAITTGRGGVAYVSRIGSSNDVVLNLVYGSQAELNAMGQQACETGGGRTVNGAFVGVGAGQMASVSVGSAITSTIGTGNRLPWMLDDVPAGTVDLIAGRSTLVGGGAQLDRLVIRRNGNPTDGATLPDIDFDGAEAFAPLAATVHIGNLLGNPAMVMSMYVTTNNAFSLLYSEGVITPASTRQWLGVPPARQAQGDLHYLLVSSPLLAFGNRQASRSAGVLVRDASEQTLTLGGALGNVAVSALATAPYVRARLATTIPPEYRKSAVIHYTQGAVGRSASITILSGSMANDGTLDTVIPDFSAVSGWNADWGLKAGTETNWGITVNGWTGNGGVGQAPLLEGGRTVSATVTDNVIFTPMAGSRGRR